MRSGRLLDQLDWFAHTYAKQIDDGKSGSYAYIAATAADYYQEYLHSNYTVVYELWRQGVGGYYYRYHHPNETVSTITINLNAAPDDDCKTYVRIYMEQINSGKSSGYARTYTNQIIDGKPESYAHTYTEQIGSGRSDGYAHAYTHARVNQQKDIGYAHAYAHAYYVQVQGQQDTIYTEQIISNPDRYATIYAEQIVAGRSSSYAIIYAKQVVADKSSTYAHAYAEQIVSGRSGAYASIYAWLVDLIS